ncbi:DUF4124 domain-containing protein [Kaarinaea lacus]
MQRRRKIFECFILFVLVILNMPWLSAAPVYKSTDSQGNVTYSSEPPPEAEKVQEVAVPKDSPANSATGGDSIGEIKKKADELERENMVREKEIQKNKQQQETKKVIVEEPPVQRQRPIIQNRPLPNPPGGGGGTAPPVVTPLPSGK